MELLTGALTILEASKIIKELEEKKFKPVEIMAITMAASKAIEAWITTQTNFKVAAAVSAKIIDGVK